MKKASYIFGILKERLHSSEFLDISRINPRDFTRNRLLTCQILLLFILNLLKKSIPKEMIYFCEYCHIDEVSRSAITQARSKLSPKAFVFLNDILVNEFYTDNKFKTFHGLIILAVDGTLLELPVDSQNILERYGFASNQTETQVPMARSSYLFDVMNGITVDAIIDSYSTGERDLALKHFEKLLKTWNPEQLQRCLCIFDRGYPSAPLIIYLIMHKIFFLMRCNSKFIKEVDNAVANGKKDTIIKFSAKRNGSARVELKKLFPHLNENEDFLIRVLVITLPTGEKEILLTSLLDKQKYPYKLFLDLYYKRWGAEENYKFYKLQMEVENFSGKSCISIEQDFYATILAANARALLAFEATKELISELSFSQENEQKYRYQINKKVSMERLKNDFVAVLLDLNANVEQFCIKVKNSMKRHLIPIRPGRHYTRLRRHPNRKFHMNLR